MRFDKKIKLIKTKFTLKSFMIFLNLPEIFDIKRIKNFDFLTSSMRISIAILCNFNILLCTNDLRHSFIVLKMKSTRSLFKSVFMTKIKFFLWYFGIDNKKCFINYFNDDASFLWKRMLGKKSQIPLRKSRFMEPIIFKNYSW